ncbi:glucosamine-6-phosphate deaminase [Geminicoccus roseus]|uniref:glucosamine-6-phosphate deaminase n=1 Tax=Geminicoccus roseus TaxID=404900 RepID=UPI0003FA22AB|nr:glucosamine-6-phosphate deaminase [Geminicoccus roseus]
MQVVIKPSKTELGAEAARIGAEAIRDAIAARGEAVIVVATGASQFEMLERLVAAEGIDWSKVTAFHLDEYVGLPADHPASFRRYLAERFVTPLGGRVRFVPVDGDAGDPAAEAKRLGERIGNRPIDVCFAGIGENCHLAFNDPPADFETEEPFIVVTLDEACRRQQLGEGWFPSLEDVPATAISMSVRQIAKAARVVLSVPDARKAEAVRHAVEGPVTPDYPASILQQHPDCVLLLDPASASQLSGRHG